MIGVLARILHWIIAAVQRLIVWLGYWWPAHFLNGRPISWVVGPNEVARMAAQIASVVPHSYSALIVRHLFYDDPYDYQPPDGERGFRRLWRLHVQNAWLFGRLVRRAEGFIYVSQNGFLGTQNDDRRFEFAFLKRHGIRIVCYFTGSDIRSLVQMRKLESQFELPNAGTYQSYAAPSMGTQEFDDSRRRIAQRADEFADLIFTLRVDQAGYLSRDTEPFIYFFPDEEIASDLTRFERPKRVVVVHAPSSPVAKGTQVVRAAVDGLRRSGWDFEYVELIGVSHSQVRDALQRAHIVLNQFYAFAPGVFGVEAMAAGCILLTSADEHIETDLPAGSNAAWVVTRHYEVRDRLEEILRHPDRMREQAEAGIRWVREHAASSRSGERLRSLLADLLKNREVES